MYLRYCAYLPIAPTPQSNNHVKSLSSGQLVITGVKMSFKLLVVALPALALACTGPPINQNDLDLINNFESFQPNEYDDGFGNSTIGYGYLCADTSCSDVSFP